MVDAEDSKSSAARHVGSSPTSGTNSFSSRDVRRGIPRLLGLTAKLRQSLSDSRFANHNNALTGNDPADLFKLARIVQQRRGKGGEIAAVFRPDG